MLTMASLRKDQREFPLLCDMPEYFQICHLFCNRERSKAHGRFSERRIQSSAWRSNRSPPSWALNDSHYPWENELKWETKSSQGMNKSWGPERISQRPVCSGVLREVSASSPCRAVERGLEPSSLEPVGYFSLSGCVLLLSLSVL